LKNKPQERRSMICSHHCSSRSFVFFYCLLDRVHFSDETLLGLII